VQHLREEAKGVDYLVLWLDCDLEGENICFEVMDCCLPKMKKISGQQVFRAKFSSISAPDIERAMNTLVSPNKNESDAVEARQELDLKIGVVFTRFQTRYFQGKYTGLDSGVISYGPCQTPTLGFCVDRHDKITSFQPEPYWTLDLSMRYNNKSVTFTWGKGKVFDQDVAGLYKSLVNADSECVVTSVKEVPGRKSRPTPLNTVELLRIASRSLGIGPKDAMYYAEQLYLRGYTSYPRTESTAYPLHFDIREAIAQQSHHDSWGPYVRSLLATGLNNPKKGVDVGDHPPITPVRCAQPGELGSGEARIYDIIVRNFIASVSPDCKFLKTNVVVTAGGEDFVVSGKVITDPGFTLVLEHKSFDRHEDTGDILEEEEEEEEDTTLPAFTKGDRVKFDVSVRQGKTAPPGYLAEHELITLMEKNGIGTDASIPTHINNITVRNYVRVTGGRTMTPTDLGIVLVHGYHLIDPDLVLPAIRMNIEKECTLIAKGKAKKEDVVAHALEVAKKKFIFFSAHIEAVNALFEATFSPLVDSSKLLSRCGKCKRIMKHVKLPRAPILHCTHCNETYGLPVNGTVKLYMGQTCPLDNFELVQFSLGNKARAMGKTFTLCPYCYNNPPFEGVTNMGCDTCTHPTCSNSLVFNGVCPCPGDEDDDSEKACDGTMVIDTSSHPNWKLCCNKCNQLMTFSGLHSLKVSRKSNCEECGSKILILDFNKDSCPLADGETKYRGCPVCDDLIDSLARLKEGRSKNIELTRGKGKRRGRGGKRKWVDPRMTFDRF
jgi:DNA topoisomerase-3